MTTKFTWNETNTAQLLELAGTEVVTQAQLDTISEELGTTARSIGAKLRNLGLEVEKASAKPSAWTPEQEAALATLVNDNAGVYTYAEIAAQFEGGAFKPNQIQGKILSMELYGSVRKAVKVAAKRTYSEDEEVKFVELANSGATMEELAEAFGKELSSVRGKALSLLKSEHISEMPKQSTSSAKSKADVLEGLDVASMTVEAIVEASGSTARGIKSILSRRGITCSNYDGAAKRAKLDKDKS